MSGVIPFAEQSGGLWPVLRAKGIFAVKDGRFQPGVEAKLDWRHWMLYCSAMGRPKLSIDETQVRRLAEIQATSEEIAFVVGCSVDTLERRFRRVIAVGRASGKLSIRRALFQMAMEMGKHSPALLIYLDKKYVGVLPEVPSKQEAMSGSALPRGAFELEHDKSRAIELLREVLSRDLAVSEIGGPATSNTG